MNIKRILGFACILLGFLIPFQSALSQVDDRNNVLGLVSFVGFMVLVFVGYTLVDSSYPKPGSTEPEH